LSCQKKQEGLLQHECRVAASSTEQVQHMQEGVLAELGSQPWRRMPLETFRNLEACMHMHMNFVFINGILAIFNINFET